MLLRHHKGVCGHVAAGQALLRWLLCDGAMTQMKFKACAASVTARGLWCGVCGWCEGGGGAGFCAGTR